MIATAATEKQFSFLRKLVAERDLDAETQQSLETSRRLAVEGRLTARQASALIDLLMDAPRKEETAPEVAEPEAGVYRHGASLYRVYRGQNRGRMLVKLVEVVEEVPGEFDLTVDYTYLGLASHRLPAGADRLSLEEVGKLGVKYGSCLVCGRRLDDPESVDRGIGPVCAGKY